MQYDPYVLPFLPKEEKKDSAWNSASSFDLDKTALYSPPFRQPADIEKRLQRKGEGSSFPFLAACSFIHPQLPDPKPDTKIL